MNVNHTPGPWTVRHADDQEYPYPARLILGERGLLVAIARAAGGPDKNAAANARRIVACVNYCEGVSTEEIEAAPAHLNLRALLDHIDGVTPKVMDQYDALKALNAELVEALTECEVELQSEFTGVGDKDLSGGLVPRVRALLAKATS